MEPVEPEDDDKPSPQRQYNQQQGQRQLRPVETSHQRYHDSGEKEETRPGVSSSNRPPSTSPRRCNDNNSDDKSELGPVPTRRQQRRRQRGSYRPLSLRWPFLAAEMAVLAAALAAVLALQGWMPDSDNSAVVVDDKPPALVGRAGGVHRQAPPPAPDAEVAAPPLRRNADGDKPRARYVGDEAAASAVVSEDPSLGPLSPAAAVATLTATAVGGDKDSSIEVVGPPPGRGSRPPRPTPTLNPSVSTTESRTTDDVVHSTFMPGGEPQTIKQPVQVTSTPHPTGGGDSSWGHGFDVSTAADPTQGPNETAPPKQTGGSPAQPTQPAPSPPPPAVTAPASKTTELLVGGTTTTVVVGGKSHVGVIGAQLVQTVVADDGLVVRTSAIVGTLGATTITSVTTPPPQTVVRTTMSPVAGGNGALTAVVVTDVVTPPPQTVVSTFGGTLVTLVEATTSASATGSGAGATAPAPTPTGLSTGLDKGGNGGGSGGGSNSAGGNGTTDTVDVVLPPLGEAYHFLGTFLPTLIAVALAAPLAVIDADVKLMQPFQTLASSSSADGGARGADTLTLAFGGGFLGVSRAATAPLGQALARPRGRPATLITGALVWLSWLLAPLAAEAIGVKLHGTCTRQDWRGCGVLLGVSPAPAKALAAVIVAMLLLLAALIVVLARDWTDTGLKANPWSLTAITALTHSRALREPLVGARVGGVPSEAELREAFADGSFRLGLVTDAAVDDDSDGDDDGDDGNGNHFGRDKSRSYGIVPVAMDWRRAGGARQNYYREEQRRERRRRTPFPALTYTWRIVFTVGLLGLMALVTYYHLLRDNNAFEQFMDSQTFGVKFLFASLGTAISCFWGSFFQSLATVTPFMRMSRPRLPDARRSVLLHPPTSALSGLLSFFAAGARLDALLLFAAALASLLAQLLLPPLLANVPYDLTQTWATHIAATYGALAVLALAVVVLAASFAAGAARRGAPDLPVDPRTVAGAMYYVAEQGSQLRRDLRRVGPVVAWEDDGDDARGRRRDEGDSWEDAVQALGRRYFYSSVIGSNGNTRMVVDAEAS